MTYPVSVVVAPPLAERNRLTTAFRLILAIPHLILVGGIGSLGAVWRSSDTGKTIGGEGGLLGAVAVFLAIVSWITIVLTGNHIAGIRQFTAFYLRWRTRAMAYVMLLEDVYPPFGDAPYPVSIDIVDPITPRDRLSVVLRLIYAIPQIVVLFFVQAAWWIVTVVAWFAIVFMGTHPQGLYEFSVGVLRWRLRVDAYLLLMVDEYPPFSLT